MAEIKNIHQLPEFVRPKVLNYAQKFLELHGSNVIALVVYGSAASGNFVPKVSDINLAAVFKTLAFDDLKKSLPLVREGKADHITAPLLLTREYIRQSLDVFPVEFLDLKDQHVLLYGDDVFSSLNVDARHLKIFCEQQIKGKLLRIRQAYLEIGLHPKGKEALLKDSLNALIPIFRNLFRLAGKPIPAANEDLFKTLGLEFGIDGGVLLAIYRDRNNDEKIAGHDVENYLQQYVEILEKLAAKVD
jgi:predicted nucleotidyltransferase